MKNQAREEEESFLGEKRGSKLPFYKKNCGWIILLWLLLSSQVGTNRVESASSSWPMFQHDPQRSGRSYYPAIKQPVFKWNYFAKSYIFASPVIDYAGKIYLITEDGNLHIIASSGKEEKIISIGVKSDSTPAISKEGNIYVAISDGHILCFNPEGKNEWVYTAESKIISSPLAISDDGTIFVGCEDGTLQAINKDGSLKWKYQTSSSIQSSPAISKEGIIYVGCNDGTLYAINKDGSLVFKKEIKKSAFSSPVIDSEGNIYVGGSNRDIVVITKDGDLHSIPVNSSISSSPTISEDGSIYIGSDGGLYGITPKGIWCVKTGKIFNSAPVITSDGIIYIASFDGKIHAIEPKEGGIIWSYEIGFGPTSLAIDQKGTIYVGSRDKNLYAIGERVMPTPKEAKIPLPQIPKIIKEEKKVEKKVKIKPPASPTNLVLTVESAEEIRLNWQDNADNETEYRIYRKQKEETTYTLVKTLPPDSQSFLDTTLQPGTTYIYRVVACNKMGFSEYSAQAVATTKPQLSSLPPKSPSDLKVGTFSTTEVTISWVDNSDDEEGFYTKRKLRDEYILIATLEANTTLFQDVGLSPKTTYSYCVAAYNAVGISAYSNEVIITTKAGPPPAPRDLKVIDFSTRTVSLTWLDTSTNEQGFKIERDNTQITTLLANTTSFQDINLVPDTSYSYRVLSFNDAGNSAYSNEVQVTTKSTPPLPPSNLKVTETSPHKISLFWEDNSNNELGFRLERKKLKEEYTLIAMLPSNTTTSEDMDVTPLTTYSYRVSAYNKAGSAYSKEIKVTTQDTLPLAPTDLQVSPISQNSIKITWCDNSNNELGFKLERASPLQKYVLIKLLPAGTTSYLDKGLTKDTSYSYRIKAYNKLGDSEYSNPSGVRTLDVLPKAPTHLIGISKISRWIDLSWQDNSDNEVGFKIERRLKTEDYIPIAILNQDTTSYQDSNLTPNTTYCYRVRAYNRTGNSAYSNVLTITTLPVIPFVPTNLKITPVSSNQINLSWCDNSDNEMGFRIERKTEGKEYEEIYLTLANVTTYQDKALEPNTTYFYRVRAYNQAGNSSYSNEQETTTMDIPPYPPSNLLAKPISTMEIDLTWQDNSTNERGFKIERSKDGKEYAQITVLFANTTTYQDKDLLQNTTYYYRVKAYNLLGDSGYSNEVACKTLDVVPLAPTNLKTTPILPEKIKLTWEDNSDNESGFKIERRRKDETTYNQLDTVSKNITEYQDKGIFANITYLYRVCGYNEAGNSAYSNESSAEIIQVIPAKPTFLEAETISHSEIVLIWQDNSDNESGFKIERKNMNEKGFVQIDTTRANISSYHDVGLTPDTIYYYFVRAYNEAGDSDYSNIASAKTNPVPSKPTSKIQPIDYSEITSPKLLWTFPTKARISRSNPIIDSEGRIYIGSEDGVLYCISSEGKLVWSYSTKGGINTAPAIGEDGEIYLVSTDKNLYAILPDGTLKWKYPLKFPTEASCLVAPNFAIHIFTWNGKVYSLHPDGKLRWLSSLDGRMITHTPSIDDKGNIYIGASGADGGLFCLNSKGELKWKYTEGGEAATSPAFDSNGNIYIGLNNTLYSFNSEGVIRFKIEHEKNCWLISSPVISPDGVIYYNLGMSSQEGYLRAVRQDGQVLWKYPIGWNDISPIIDSVGNIYVISKDYNLSCLSSKGELKWNYTLDSKITTSPNISKDGSIYLGANNGLLYTISNGETKPPLAPGNLVTEVVSSNEINISWQDNSRDELGFIIERGMKEDVYSQLAVLPPNTTSYQDTNLLPITTYYYRIKAFNKNGDSDYSPYSYAMTLTLPPGLPTGISITPIKEGEGLKLSWQKPKEKEFSHLQIYRSIVKDKLGTLIADGIKETSYVDTDLVNNLPYYYTFFAYDIYGNKSIPSVQYVRMPKDSISPEIISYSPIGTNISPEVPITISFSEKMDKESVKESFSITPSTKGSFTWEGNKFFFIPLSDLSGNTKYTIRVSGNAKDTAGNYIQKPLTYQFTTFNPSPIIWSYTPIDLSPSMFEGESLHFEVYASDPNQDDLKYNWNLNGIKKSTTNSWTYTPSATDAGIKTLILSVTDGTSVVIQNWTITVMDKNIPPKLSVREDTIINVNELIQFNISAVDEDNDPLTYTTSILPKGATFSPQTKIFSWCPKENQAGTHRIIFKVSDGKGGEDTKEIKIQVNLPPKIGRVWGQTFKIHFN